MRVRAFFCIHLCRSRWFRGSFALTATTPAVKAEWAQWCFVSFGSKGRIVGGDSPRDVSRVRRPIIQEYSPGIGFPHPFVVVILYHIQSSESERFVKYA